MHLVDLIYQNRTNLDKYYKVFFSYVINSICRERVCGWLFKNLSLFFPVFIIFRMIWFIYKMYIYFTTFTYNLKNALFCLCRLIKIFSQRYYVYYILLTFIDFHLYTYMASIFCVISTFVSI